MQWIQQEVARAQAMMAPQNIPQQQCGLAGSDMKTPTTSMEELQSRAHSHLGRLLDIADRLQMVTDRMFGSGPSAPESANGVAPSPMGAFARAVDTSESIERTIQRIDALVRGVEQIV